MTLPCRLTDGGVIDRTRPLRFTFDGRSFTGHAGDTLASALLANGVLLVGRSFKYHRQRGIMAAGVEEPNALVRVGTGAHAEPNVQATTVELYDGLVAESQNKWPSLSFDIGAIIDRLSRFFPAGFYYKTFMWPAKGWRFYEYFIRRAAGLGVCPDQPDPDCYDQRHAHFDVLVAGAGPAGIAAALQAARQGARVCLVEQSPALGGMLLHHRDQQIDGMPSEKWLASALDELRNLANVTVLTRTTVAGNYGHGFFIAVEHRHLAGLAPQARLPRQRLWKIRARQAIFATGAHERPLLFANNDKPGVMLADALSVYVRRYAVLPGRRIIVFANNDSAYRAAIHAAEAGAAVRVVDLRVGSRGYWPERARAMSIPVEFGKAVVSVRGRNRVSAAEIMTLSADGIAVGGKPEIASCDLVAVSGGWSPVIHLHAQDSKGLRYDAGVHGIVATEPAPGSSSICVGGANGSFDLADALGQGSAAGAAAAAEAGSGDGLPMRPGATDPVAADPPADLWLIPAPAGRRNHYRKHFHEFQNDSTVADIDLAVREGFSALEHLKRYTTTGMATDQGKTSNVNVVNIVSRLTGRDVSEMAPTTYRPPFTPITLGTVAGRRHGPQFTPMRKTPIQPWHEAKGAPMECVGDWLRPWWFPGPGEDKAASVTRECLAVRQAVGITDASTLGKIDIRGRDAGEFLDRVYTNAWSKLAVGKCRYGLMLNEQGFVFDDGVTTRLAEDHYHMTTSTGGAARVMTWLEDWLQTEWPNIDVYLTSVTDQWAVISLNGPRARDLLSEVCDADLSAEAFPFMSFRMANVAGVPARIFRVSFAGELGFEINVAARHGLAVWQSVWNAGQEYGVTAYGNEAAHVLRAEKGFIIVGQDTDGTVTPMDLGMERIVSGKKPDFLGKGGLSLPAIASDPRKQLVGLLADDPAQVVPEGAHITAAPDERFPCSSEGHITSSYFSPILGRSIALGLLLRGRDRAGERIFARNLDGSAVPMIVSEPVFYDPAGEKSRG